MFRSNSTDAFVLLVVAVWMRNETHILQKKHFTTSFPYRWYIYIRDSILLLILLCICLNKFSIYLSIELAGLIVVIVVVLYAPIVILLADQQIKAKQSKPKRANQPTNHHWSINRWIVLVDSTNTSITT